MAETGKTLEQELAEEIRAAVAAAVPPAARATHEDRGAPDSLRLAEAYLTPSVPVGARAAVVKRMLLRGFRFLWRDQGAFNALTLDALRRMRQEREVRFAELRDAVHRDLSEFRRRAAIQDARFGLLEAAPSGLAVPEAAREARAEELPPAVYSLFEERFRGSPEAIAEGQRAYVAIVREAPGPVIDAGCGRGEFLRLLRDAGIPAVGIESNPVSVRLCRETGLEVEEGEALSRLAARAPDSLGAVVAFQVVEHWPAARIFAFLREARRALKPEGILVVETVNTDSLSALRTFFLDPTHVRPVPPAALAFLAEAAGFSDGRVEYRAPLPESERLAETTGNDAKLNRLLFGPQDYALIARVPKP